MLEKMARAMAAEMQAQSQGPDGEAVVVLDDGRLWVNGPIDQTALVRAALQAVKDEFNAPLGYDHHGIRTAAGMTAFRSIRELDRKHGQLSGGFRDHDDLTAADAIIPAMIDAILSEETGR
jgi:hypothetical protein